MADCFPKRNSQFIRLVIQVCEISEGHFKKQKVLFEKSVHFEIKKTFIIYSIFEPTIFGLLNPGFRNSNNVFKRFKNSLMRSSKPEKMNKTIRYFFIKTGFQAMLLLILLLQSTAGNAQSCNYTLSMYDSYGDGWNGGHLQVYINSAFVGNFAGSNYASSATFQVNSGDEIELYYNSGSYEEENKYQLFDAAWNLIFADGPNPQTGLVFSTTGNCNSVIIPGSHPCTAMPVDTVQCVVADNSAMPGSGFNAGCANYSGADIWFAMQTPPSGNVSFETDNGTINDTGLAVWSDFTCTSPKLIACDDDGGNGSFSLLNLFDLPPGQTLFIQVWGYGGATGSFELCAKDLGQVTLESSELPIVIINTLGQTIVPDVKIDALMEIKYNGPGNLTYVTDPPNEYDGHVGIEIRGASSSGYPQHPYGFETRTESGGNNNVSILGMPAENDWVLLSNYNDRSLIRNPLAFKLFAEMGNYSPRTSLCEVLLDSAYQGIYVFGEKIKRDNGRVDIATLNPADTIGDELTGGYILQQNYWDANNSFQSNFSPIDHPTFDVHFVYEYPKPDEIMAPQKAYIAAFVDSLETALYSENFADSLNGYRKYLDVKSFIDYFLVNELSRNNDGFKKSVFFHKDKFSKGGKLKAGPVWDFDWAWKNMWGCSIFENQDGSGWAHHINDCPTDNYSCGWYIRLLQDNNFTKDLRCAWEDYRQTILDTTYIFSYIDSIGNLVQNAQVRHFQKWPILGISGPAPEVGAIATTYPAELDTLKHWINFRLAWLDANIPGLCLGVINSVDENESASPLKYYPNPGSGRIHFEGFLEGAAPYELKIFDAEGRQIERTFLNSGQVNLDYQLDKKGFYFFTISNSDGIFQYGKLIVI